MLITTVSIFYFYKDDLSALNIIPQSKFEKNSSKQPACFNFSQNVPEIN